MRLCLYRDESSWKGGALLQTPQEIHLCKGICLLSSRFTWPQLQPSPLTQRHWVRVQHHPCPGSQSYDHFDSLYTPPHPCQSQTSVLGSNLHLSPYLCSTIPCALNQSHSLLQAQFFSFFLRSSDNPASSRKSVLTRVILQILRHPWSTHPQITQPSLTALRLDSCST